MERQILNTIDFSDGIRAEEIKENFDLVMTQLERERLAIAGYGVASGIGFTVNNFQLKISKGVVVDNSGKEIFYDDTFINIELPIIEPIEELVSVQSNGNIVLGMIPYLPSRLGTSDSTPIFNINNSAITGVQIISTSNNKNLPVKAIDGNTVTIDKGYSNSVVKAKYSYTYNRIDTVYIDKDYNIKIAQGTQSTSPSGYIPSNCKYLLGFLDVNAFQLVDGIKKAKLEIRMDLRRLRNIYTDNTNKLYINGLPFDELQIVHMTKPTDPLENTLWYDILANKLLVWRTNSGISEWIAVNDSSYVPVLESKIWTPEDLITQSSDLQTFLFSKDQSVPDLNMLFMPGRHELEILIDNAPLMSDQFIELTSDTENLIPSGDNPYENTGIGFKLLKPLDKPAYVEARVTHRMNHNPLPLRLQRSATFSAEEFALYNTDNTLRTFNTIAPYRLGETQLEVYVEGRKLDIGVDYLEGSDLDNAMQVKGSLSRQFKILKSLVVNDRVSHKVTANIYSYDNVTGLIDDLREQIFTAVTNATEAAEAAQTLIDSTTDAINSIQAKVNTIETKVSKVDNAIMYTNEFGKPTEIPEANMPASINKNIPSGLIDYCTPKIGSIMPVNFADTDYINVFDMNATGGNSILRRGYEYVIIKGSTEGEYYIHFQGNFDSDTTNNHTLYFSGIRFGKSSDPIPN